MAVMYIDRAEYNMKRNIRLWFQELLELLFEVGRAGDRHDTDVLPDRPLHTGPDSICGFGSMKDSTAFLTQWITRYISMSMWLPVSDLFSWTGTYPGLLMLTRDIEAMSDPSFIRTVQMRFTSYF